MIKKYKKIAEVIEAVQWTGDNTAEISDWVYDKEQNNPQFIVTVRDGEQQAMVFDYLVNSWICLKIGDWIVRGNKEDFYPLSTSIFSETYEEL